MTDINDWPGHPDADPDCECCLGDGLQADGETPCPCQNRRPAPDSVARLVEAALRELVAACEAYPVNIARADAALDNARAVLRALKGDDANG